jgi:hypothetical protein
MRDTNPKWFNDDIKRLKIKAKKAGIKVVLVDPKYTSVQHPVIDDNGEVSKCPLAGLRIKEI